MLEVIEGKPPLPRLLRAVRARPVRGRPPGGLGGGQRPGATLGGVQPDARQQRRDALERPAHPRSRRRLVPLDGHTPSRPARSCARGRRRRRARRRRARAGHAARRRHRRRRQRGRVPGRTVKAAFSGVANPVLTAEHLGVGLSLRGACRRPAAGLGAAGFIVLRRHRVHGRTPPARLALPLRRVVWPVPAVQARQRATSPAASSGIEAGVGDEHDIEQIRAGSERVTDGDRCFLAIEEQRVVASVLDALRRRRSSSTSRTALPTAPAARPSRS